MPSRLDSKSIAEILRRFEEETPDPKTELYFTNRYTLLVAVVLSAQSTDRGVNKATRPLFENVRTPEEMVALGEENLRDAIKTIGLFNTKAKNIIKLSHLLIAHHQSQVPESREALEALPGVGRKTANVVLSVAFGQPTIAVDTHLFRVSRRLGLSDGKTPLAVEKDLIQNIPEGDRARAHHWLILHGRYVCKAQNPQCLTCALRDLCLYEEKRA